jgi:hypothetical protein
MIALHIVIIVLLLWEKLIMPIKGVANVKRNRKATDNTDQTEDPLGDLASGDFEELPESLSSALGATVRAVTRRGGYFGLSTTDDGGSAKLVVRTGKVHVDRRFYKLADLEAAIAKIFAAVRSRT